MVGESTRETGDSERKVIPLERLWIERVFILRVE